MIKYLYVPKDKNPMDYLDQARQEDCNQIIHGDSEIINDLVENKDSLAVVHIPKIKTLLIEKPIYEFGEEVKFIFTDEWVRQEKCQSVDTEIYLVDIEDPSKIDFINKSSMSFDGEFSFYHKFVPEQYGEYIVQIYANYEDGERKKKITKSFIVYKNEEMSIRDEKFFSFEL